MAELENTYKPQKDLYNAQLAQLPAQYEAQTQGLNVAKENAFRDILGAASARGIAYSGMPIQEQTRYTGEKYLPALAALKADQNQRQFSLQDALAKILQGQTSQAYDLRNAQLKAEQEAAQAEADRQAKLLAARYSSRGGGGGGGGSTKAPSINDAVALVNSLRSSGQYGDSGYGSIAQALAGRGYDISRDSLFDRALRKAFGFG